MTSDYHLRDQCINIWKDDDDEEAHNSIEHALMKVSAPNEELSSSHVPVPAPTPAPATVPRFVIRPTFRAGRSLEMIKLNWNIQYTNWVTFYKTYNKCPSANSKDIAERKLAHWRDYQINKFKHDTLSKELYNILNHTEGWSWNTNLSGIKRKATSIDEEGEEIIPPPSKRRRTETTWMAEKEHLEYTKKISELEGKVAHLTEILQKQSAVMLKQKARIEELQSH